MNTDELECGPVIWQPAMTALEVRLEREDKQLGRHWDWAGGCWCAARHHPAEGLTLVAPPWSRSRHPETAASAATA